MFPLLQHAWSSSPHPQNVIPHSQVTLEPLRKWPSLLPLVLSLPPSATSQLKMPEPSVSPVSEPRIPVSNRRNTVPGATVPCFKMISVDPKQFRRKYHIPLLHLSRNDKPQSQSDGAHYYAHRPLATPAIFVVPRAPIAIPSKISHPPAVRLMDEKPPHREQEPDQQASRSALLHDEVFECPASPASPLVPTLLPSAPKPPRGSTRRKMRHLFPSSRETLFRISHAFT